MASRPKGFETVIASPHYYEELVAEMYFRGVYIGRINKEKGDTRLEIEFDDPPPGQSATCERADLDGFLECVEIARQRLLGKIP